MQDRLSIVYGSQTGNAEDVARTIWRQAIGLAVDAELRYMDDFPVGSQAGTVVLVCSTTGQGDMPDNMLRFWNALRRRSLPADYLSQWRVAVLGLGDSSYQKFNFAARKLHRRLLQLGAVEVVELGLADDQHQRGYDEVVDAWTGQLWAQLLQRRPDQIPVVQLDQLAYDIVWLDGGGVGLEEDQPRFVAASLRPTSSCLVEAEVVQNKRITAADHFQDVRLLSLALTPNVPYNPGDVFVVQPDNLAASQRLLLQVLPSLADCLDRPFRLQRRLGAAAAMSVPDFCRLLPRLTFRQLVSSVFDLQAVPRRSFFQMLSTFAVDPMHRQRLQEFGSADGQEDMHDYCSRPRRTVVEVLADFADTAARLPLAALFDLLGTVKPRAYSIASCVDTSDHVELLVAVVRYKTSMAQARQGLCSTWLSGLEQGDKLVGWIKPGSFRFPATESPVILIGPGTGVASLRSFLMFRCCRGMASSWLFFGCRNREKDFLCEQDFRRMVERGTMQLTVAFSRDQQSKVYVQHKLNEHKSLVYDLIRYRGAFVLISGNAKNMPLQVKEAIKDILKSEGGLNENEAQKYMREMDTSRRLQLEVWS